MTNLETMLDSGDIEMVQLAIFVILSDPNKIEEYFPLDRGGYRLRVNPPRRSTDTVYKKGESMVIDAEYYNLIFSPSPDFLHMHHHLMKLKVVDYDKGDAR